VRAADDFHAARIANAALSSGFTSRLVKVVRVQHGLTHGITSAFMNSEVCGGAFLIELSVNPANVDRAIELVRGAVDNLIETGITEFEVALRRADAIASTMVQYELSGSGIELWMPLRPRSFHFRWIRSTQLCANTSILRRLSR
jgi:Predicted Zn-dependent peptidases